VKLLLMNAVARSYGFEIEPHRLSAPDAVSTRLRQRLGREVRTGEALAACLAYGASWPALCELVRYLQDGFQLEQQALFDLSCFEARLGNARLCFVHERSSQRSALPLLLLHGYSASLAEFQAHVLPLAAGAHGRAHHVVCPSLPGFGFSGGAQDARATAELCAALMARLGYARYMVHGSELGAKVALELAALDEEHVVAAHVTSVAAYPAAEPLSPPEKSRAIRLFELESELALAGTAAPLAELARALSQVDEELGAPARSLHDGVLTGLALSLAFASSDQRARLHAARFAPAPSSRVPLAVDLFPLDAPSFRGVAAQRYRIAEWNEHRFGGAMPALEQPALWSASVARCAAQLDS